MTKTTVSLFLMTEKGFTVLKELIDLNLHALIDTVIIGRDGALQHDFSKEIEELCQENEILISERADSIGIQSNYTIAVAWRWLLTLPNTKLIVLHDSLLPKYRGFAPLVNQLINQEKMIGVTALFADQNYDEGDIILQESISITYPLKIQKAIQIISQLYAKVVVDLFGQFQQGNKLVAKPQNHKEATYSLWRDEEDYFINWHLEAAEIVRTIHALGYPYDGAKAFIDDDAVNILDAIEVDDVNIENRDVGKVLRIDGLHPVVVCGFGLIKILELTDEETGEPLLPLKKFRTRFS